MAIQLKLKEMTRDAQVKEGLLYKQVGSKWLTRLRPSTSLDAALEGHQQVGYSAARKTYKWLKTQCYWDLMINTIQKVFKSCLVCKNHAGPNP